MSTPARETPMMRQYLEIKRRHPREIVFYRMGDFYEMFLEDAERAAPLLDIALTTRDKGKPDAVPMCGVPVHAADQHVKRLAELGHRVAICEQVEDARAAGGRRLVRREVVEVVTPGLVGDPQGLPAAREVAVAALEGAPRGGAWGLAALEASTGDFRATRVPADPDGDAAPAALLDELARIAPRELIAPEPALGALGPPLRMRLPDLVLTAVPPASFEPAAVPRAPHGFDPDARDAGTRTAAAMIAYLEAHQPFVLAHGGRLRHYALGEAMVLDASTCAHLELFANGEDGGRRHTLIERIDACRGPLGSRRLARWLAYPLCDARSIAARQDAVAFLAERDRPRGRLREALGRVRDLERLLAVAARPGATPRDLARLRDALEALPAVAGALRSGDDAWLPDLAGEPPPALPLPEPVSEAATLLREALVDEPPAVPRGSRGAGETGYVRQGFHAELDAVRESARKGREWIAGIETREREAIGLPGLRMRFHPVHGFALEVGKAHLKRVPDRYERKQTLASVERFTTPELREVEARVLGAGERAAELERALFETARRASLEHAAAIREAADAVAELDALAALAEVARRDGWVRPVVDDSDRLDVRAGRHPVVEPLTRAIAGGDFVPNDTELDGAERQILVLTGPNMSGKSTYLRQVALIALLAQIGSFVPAESARVGVVDRIFTRVGASDRLARGESTFMVEMRETAEILSQASPRSLVILDEIGRGTSTWDGLSIAWAVIEYLHETPGLRARTLFATHYHELADLADDHARIRNGHFEAREWGEDVVFLRRLVPGAASRSYGIQVARLAGLPEVVIGRARELLARLESGSAGPVAAGPGAARRDQLDLFARAGAAAAAPVLERLRAIDPDRTTPIDALVALRELCELARREDPA